MVNTTCLNDGMKHLSYDELMSIGGRDYIRETCALLGFVAFASGGVITANPIGMTAVGFCVGYGLGVVIANWLT